MPVLLSNAVVVMFGAVILVVGFIYAIRIISILRPFGLARPWLILSILIGFFFLGYIFIALLFLDVVMTPMVTMEGMVTSVFFFGAVFVVILAVLNQNLFGNIFGQGIDDTKAFRIFADHVGMPPRKVMAMTRPEYRLACEICQGDVKYSIPELVRSHPRIERGVVVDRAMGGTSYRFYVRHYCEKELREIPVRHDSQFEYRSHRPSRPV